MSNEQLANVLQALAEEAVSSNNSQKLPITANVNTATFALIGSSLTFTFTSKHTSQIEVRFDIEGPTLRTSCPAAPTNQLLYTMHTASMLITAIKAVYEHPNCDECAERLWHDASFRNNLCHKDTSNETCTIEFDLSSLFDLTSK